MADYERKPGEPDFKDVQKRIRRWLHWAWGEYKRQQPDATQVQFARALALSKQYVGQLLKPLHRSDELPSMECFIKMHYRMQLDAYRMLHADPGEMVEIAPPPTAQHPTKRAVRK